MGTKLAAALAGIHGAPKGGKKFAEGGMVDPEEKYEEEGFECSPELKLAAYEVMDALGVSFGGGGEERAEKVAKALFAFFQLADAEPHKEGAHVGE